MVGEEVVELFFAEDAAKLAEGEERKEGAEDDDGAGDELVPLHLVEDGSGWFVVDEALDELLEDVEGEDEEGEDERFEKNGLVERAAFGTLAEVHHLADEDDLADDQRVDDGEGVVEGGGVVVALHEEVGVGDDGAEEDGQVGGDDGEVLELVGGALLEAGSCGCCWGGWIPAGHVGPSWLRRRRSLRGGFASEPSGVDDSTVGCFPASRWRSSGR